MNILVVNHYAGSPTMGMEFRPYYLAKEWTKQGHNVVVLAASNSHLRRIQPVVKKKITEEIFDGVKYIWIKTPKYSGNSPKRILNMLSFVSFLNRKASYFSNLLKPDVVIASSTYPLDNYPCFKIAKKSGAKLVYEIHDLWPLSPMELGGYSAKHPFIRIMQKAENFAYQHCDSVISILPKTLQHTVEHGLNPEKWSYIPNGVVSEDWLNYEELDTEYVNRIKTLSATAEIKVGYTGTLGIANAMDTFVDAAKMAQNLPIAFFIAGPGPEKERLQKRKIDENIGNLHFLETVPKTKIPALLQHFDILYAGFQKQPLFRFGISLNKIYDYMMSGKPLIQAIEAGNDPVGEAGCGYSIKAENPEEVVRTLANFLKIHPNERDKLGQNGRKFVLENHDYKILAQRFIDTF